MAKYLDSTGLAILVKNIKRLPPSYNWTTVTQSPFVIDKSYNAGIQRADTGNGTYLWKITINNVDSESQEFYVQQGSRFIQYGIYLEAKQKGSFTIELPKTTPNNNFSVEY